MNQQDVPTLTLIEAIKLRRQRLLYLADFLEELPKRSPKTRFNMTEWAYHRGAHRPKSHNYCGTAACALGHAAMLPRFKRLGLRLQWVKSGTDEVWRAFVKFQGRRGHEAGAAFFLLSPEEAGDLFYSRGIVNGGEWGSRQRTRGQVVKLLRRLARETMTT